MAGPHDKRKPFQGKTFHKDLRDYKNQEIKRSLVHRARLRKNYFKLLEEEGEVPPQEEGEENDASDREEPSSRSRAPLPPQKAPKRAPPQKAQPKPMNFAERAKLAKERKDDVRKQQLNRVQERRRTLEVKNKERERRKESLSQKTRTGQPVMGPKISNLLEQIRKNN